jgi:hypothetical protein
MAIALFEKVYIFILQIFYVHIWDGPGSILLLAFASTVILASTSNFLYVPRELACFEMWSPFRWTE